MKPARIFAFVVLAAVAALGFACTGGSSSSSGSPTAPSSTTASTVLPPSALDDPNSLVGDWSAFGNTIANVLIKLDGDHLVIMEWGACNVPGQPGCPFAPANVPLSDVTHDSFSVTVTDPLPHGTGDVNKEKLSLETDGLIDLDEDLHFGPNSSALGHPDIVDTLLLSKCTENCAS